MVTYIYFVKCPNCEDEYFDFFDDAKGYAMGCLSQKPIITQTEVERNDFGECTDHCDLGIVWSWEDIVGKETEAEPTKSIFTKDDLKLMADSKDPEFDALDNSVDVFETDAVVEHINDGYAPIESTQKLDGIDNAVVDCEVAKVITHSEDEKPIVCKKPIPEGMTIEELVEEMEENEDTVECTWCEELFGKDQCRYEVDLGWLCGRCEAAIKSRGETLTFRENNYWDFLDEELKTKTWICEFDGHEIGTVEAATEEEAYDKMEQTYPEYHYGLYDGVGIVYPADEDELDEEVKEIHDLGSKYDGGYPEIEEVSDSHLRLCPECGKETFDTETGICIGCGFN